MTEKWVLVVVLSVLIISGGVFLSAKKLERREESVKGSWRGGTVLSLKMNENGEGIVYAASEPSESGIENLYFMDSSKHYDNTDNLSGHENILEKDGTDVVMTGDGQFTSSLPYDTRFDLVPAVKAHDNQLAYISTENVRVELEVTGDISIGPENKTGEELENFEVTDNYLHCNAVWNNGGNGYRVNPDRSITIRVSLYTYS